MVLLVNVGLLFAPAAHGGALFPGVMPLMVAILAAAILKEPFTPSKTVGLALIAMGAIGIGWITGGALGTRQNIGHALFLTAGLVWACHTVAMRRARLDGLHAAALYRLPGATPHLERTLQPGELIVDVRVPGGRYARRARYLKVRDRASYEFAVVSAAAALDIEGGVVREARIACGGVGTRPWRMRACEKLLVGKPADRDAFKRAAQESIAGAQAQSHNAYKIELLPPTIVRALELARDVI
jgi:CO dehydrogenase flavoprotein C-terminal domain